MKMNVLYLTVCVVFAVSGTYAANDDGGIDIYVYSAGHEDGNGARIRYVTRFPTPVKFCYRQFSDNGETGETKTMAVQTAMQCNATPTDPWRVV